MKSVRTILFSLAPWILYFMGQACGYLVVGAGSAIAAMLIWQATGMYHLKSTDWTQLSYFSLVLAMTSLPGFSPWLAFSPLLAPGLFTLLAFGSLALGHPFTNQFAREQIPAGYWNDPAFPFHFARVNRILTIAWGLNFCVALICGGIIVQGQTLHPWSWRALAIISFISVGALTRFFPDWYEKHVFMPDVTATPSPEVKV